MNKKKVEASQKFSVSNCNGYNKVNFIFGNLINKNAEKVNLFHSRSQNFAHGRK